MWIFCRYGFFSVVRKFDKGQPKDKPLQIRTRWTSHLKRLREAYPFLAAPVKVNRHSDYAPERIYASVEEWVKVLAGTADLPADCDNFKGYMDMDSGFRKDGLGSALHRIWSVVLHAAQEHGF